MLVAFLKFTYAELRCVRLDFGRIGISAVPASLRGASLTASSRICVLAFVIIGKMERTEVCSYCPALYTGLF